MSDRPVPIEAVFYETSSGRRVIREWLKSLDRSDRVTIGNDLMRVQYRWPIGMPLCRSIGSGLWEVRSSLPSGRIARLLFCLKAGRIVVLHGFIKKTQKTTDEDMALARRRQSEVGGQE